MTNPTTMTTRMITIATTMMTNVVSLGGGVGCVLLLTGTVPVVVVVPSLGGLVASSVLLLTGTVLVVTFAPSLLVGCILVIAPQF